MRIKFIILYCFIGIINIQAVTYNLGDGMSEFEATLNNYFSNKYWITDFSSFSYTAWNFTEYTNVNEVINVFNNAGLIAEFNQLNVAKQNGTLTSVMIANFYDDVENNISALNLYKTSVPLETDFLSISLFCLFCLFIIFLKIKLL